MAVGSSSITARVRLGRGQLKVCQMPYCKLHGLKLLATGGIVVLACSSLVAYGQAPANPRPISRPSVSPYLNLLNGGAGNEGLNYYNFVRPQQQYQKTAAQFSRNLGNLRSSVGKLEKSAQLPAQAAPITTGRMGPTGHATNYGSSGGYFPGASNGGR